MRLEEVVNTLLSKQIPFVLYQTPQSDGVDLIIDEEVKSVLLNDFSFSQKGFVFFPFDSEHEEGVFFSLANHYKVGIDTIDFSQFNNVKVPETSRHLKQIDSIAYTTTVAEAVNKIEEEEFKKVVVSKVKKQEICDVGELAQRMFKTYMNAFVYVSYTQQYGVWLGATPETLLSKKGGVIKTVALAGTQSAVGKEEKEAQWTQKEIEEQALVSRYIINCFKKIRLREFEDVGPKTVRAGELFHLKTEFYINEKELGYEDIFGQLVRLLHPTSAVCGMPLKKAKEFIDSREKNSRELYTGILGPVNVDDNSHLFVNLRSAKVMKSDLYCYAGAGITIDSDPEKEWEETELKCETILRLVEDK